MRQNPGSRTADLKGLGPSGALRARRVDATPPVLLHTLRPFQAYGSHVFMAAVTSL